MKSHPFFGPFIAVALAVPVPVGALSTAIDRDFHFPKGYDPAKAERLRALVREARWEFVDGVVSFWPPDWGTRLSFKGETAKLNEFLAAVRALPGFTMAVVLYRGRDDEQRRDSPWQLDFSHAHPNRVTVYLNVNAPGIDLGKVQLPEWPAVPADKQE